MRKVQTVHPTESLARITLRHLEVSPVLLERRGYWELRDEARQRAERGRLLQWLSGSFPGEIVTKVGTMVMVTRRQGHGGVRSYLHSGEHCS